MKQYNLRIGDVWISEEIFKRDFVSKGLDADDVARRVLSQDIDSYLKNQNSNYIEYMGLYGRLKGLNKLAMLFAHGSFKGDLKNREWTYSDDGKDYSVQDWINSADGKYHSLLFGVCNPGTCEPASKKSLLIVPDRDVAGRLFNLGTCYTLYVPEIGAVDGYTIDFELNRLKEKIKAKKTQEERRW